MIVKNTLVNFDTVEVDNYIVNDYFSKDIRISDLFTFKENFFSIYKVSDDDRIERISFELYGTTDYWDILVMINNMDPLFDMVYKYDIVENNISEKISMYENLIYSHPPLDSDTLEKIKLNTESVTMKENESKRNIYVVKPTKMSEFILFLKANNVL